MRNSAGKRLVGSICAAALLAPMPLGNAKTLRQPAADTAMQSDLCRRPAALPILKPERSNQQNNQNSRDRVMSEASPPMMAPPPSPPPPVAMPGPVVTGSRMESDASSRSDKPVAEGAIAVGKIDSGARTVDAREDERMMPEYPLPMPRPTPYPQSGLLTAGEHDDLLNPELYAEYIRNSGLGQSTPDLPRLDTERLLTIVAKDARGQAMPFVPVEVRCANGKSIVLPTVADGSSVFFPELDRLGRSVQVRAGNSNWRTVDLASAQGTQTIGFTLGGRAELVRKLDLAVVVDVTGSMSDELRFLQAELASIVKALGRNHRDLDIRVGFTFYRDQGDQFVTRTYPLSSDMNAATAYIEQQSANGGGDYPEAMEEAMIRTAGQPWRDDAVKTMLLVADAPPHDQDVGMTWRAAEHLRAERVHIVPVGASGVADLAEYLMRAMAASTQSRYTFLTDDSGIGNVHAKPAVDCYLVTRLDALLRRVIDSQISGRRIEPDSDEIIRSVGQYDAGRCILPADFGQNHQ
ncbi:MAG: vWA domain-containing protein [Pontixanthobacter sp.]